MLYGDRAALQHTHPPICMVSTDYHRRVCLCVLSIVLVVIKRLILKKTKRWGLYFRKIPILLEIIHRHQLHHDALDCRYASFNKTYSHLCIPLISAISLHPPFLPIPLLQLPSSQTKLNYLGIAARNMRGGPNKKNMLFTWGCCPHGGVLCQTACVG